MAEVSMASASYTEGGIYYYTSDHIGRPFNLRDESKLLRWYEQHYAFGESINEESLNGELSAGSGNYQISWKPSFRFPGQYEDIDMGLSATSQSLFVQNHYREYIQSLAVYNRSDIIGLNELDSLIASDSLIYGNYRNPKLMPYSYAINNPFNVYDPNGSNAIIIPGPVIIVDVGIVIIIIGVIVVVGTIAITSNPPNADKCKERLECTSMGERQDAYTQDFKICYYKCRYLPGGANFVWTIEVPRFSQCPPPPSGTIQ